jgi:hypothetical protein
VGEPTFCDSAGFVLDYYRSRSEAIPSKRIASATFVGLSAANAGPTSDIQRWEYSSRMYNTRKRKPIFSGLIVCSFSS